MCASFSESDAPRIVCIGVSRIVAVAAAVVKVLTDKLICGIIRVGEAHASLGYRSYVAVCIIGIGVGIVRAVLVCSYKRGL